MLTLSAAPATREVTAPSPSDAVLLAHADAKRVRAADLARLAAHEALSKQGVKVGAFKPLLPHVRYFWFPHDGAGVEDLLVTMKLLFNKLSTQPEFHTPALIASNVLRVDARALGWAERQLAVLERFALKGVDVYFHAKKTWNVDAKEADEEAVYVYWPGGVSDVDGEYYGRRRYRVYPKKGESLFVASPLLPPREIDELRGWLYSEAPVLNAEQFYLYVVRQQNLFNKEEGTGYYEWFGPKGLKSRDDYFEVLGLDVKRSQKLFKEWRALLISRTSDVAQNSRIVFALNGVTGRVWGTEDVFAERDRGLVARRIRRGEAVHDAEEYFGPLPNGLPITLLCKADGTLQAKAPPEVGGDKSELNVGNDPAIHDDLSCMRCHAKNDMLMPFKKRDWVRNFFAEGRGRKLTDPDPDVELEIRRQYLSDLHKLLAKDQADYADAVSECTKSARHPRGLSSTKAFDAYCKTWNRLAEAKAGVPPVTRAVACREIGCSEKDFADALEKYFKFRGQGDLILARFLDDDGGLSREEWESTYQFAAGLLKGQAVPEKIKQEKKK